MSMTHDHQRTYLSRRDEPTTTATLRDEYMAAMYTRWRTVKGLIRETVAANDALRLSARLARPVRDFRFEQDADKEAAFTEWLGQAMDDEVLEPVPSQAVMNGHHWTGSYARASSQKGIEFANRQLREAGVDSPDAEDLFNRPVHQEQLRALYRRNFTQLEGITDAVSQDLSRTLTKALAEGINPREAARRINDRVDAVGLTRARTLARTETMHAHHRHAARRYQDAGVEQVKILTLPALRAVPATRGHRPPSSRAGREPAAAAPELRLCPGTGRLTR